MATGLWILTGLFVTTAVFVLAVILPRVTATGQTPRRVQRPAGFYPVPTPVATVPVLRVVPKGTPTDHLEPRTTKTAPVVDNDDQEPPRAA